MEHEDSLRKVNDFLQTTTSEVQSDSAINSGTDEENLSFSDSEVVLAAQEQVSQEILGSISTLQSNMCSLQELIERRLSYDQTKEEAFNNLYNELDELKKNSDFEKNKPLYIDLILLFDRIESVRHDLIQRDNAFDESVPKVLETLKDELLEILYRRGIEIIESIHQEFNRAEQRAIGVEVTTIEAENNQVSRVVRRGFKHQSSLVRPEEIIIKKLQKN